MIAHGTYYLNFALVDTPQVLGVQRVLLAVEHQVGFSLCYGYFFEGFEFCMQSMKGNEGSLVRSELTPPLLELEWRVTKIRGKLTVCTHPFSPSPFG